MLRVANLGLYGLKRSNRQQAAANAIGPYTGIGSTLAETQHAYAKPSAAATVNAIAQLKGTVGLSKN